MSLSPLDPTALEPIEPPPVSRPADDLSPFRDLLLRKKHQITELANRTLAEEMGLSTNELADLVDHASTEILQGFEFRLRTRERHLLKKVNIALDKIGDGSYGECEECGDEIGHARLMARPEAPLCIECKEDEERREALELDES